MKHIWALFVYLIGISVTGAALGTLYGTVYGFLVIGGGLILLSIVMSFIVFKKG